MTKARSSAIDKIKGAKSTLVLHQGTCSHSQAFPLNCYI